VSPLTGVWQGVATTIMFGIPVLATIAYALHQLLPALARFHERHGAALHGFSGQSVSCCSACISGWPLMTMRSDGTRLATVVTLAIAIVLLVWQQSRATKAQRLPLLLLTVVGVGAIYAFADYVGDGLQYGGWVFTAGWLLAVGAEVNGLRGAPQVSPGARAPSR